MPDPRVTGWVTVQELVKEAEDKLVEAQHLSNYFEVDASGRPVDQNAATELSKILIAVKTWVVRYGWSP
jgi:hypothetical protein